MKQKKHDDVAFICPKGHIRWMDKCFDNQTLIMQCHECEERMEFKRREDG